MHKQSELRGAQSRTITAFYENASVQAILPMGAGKTVSALTAFSELKRDGHVDRMYVIAPKRVAQLVWPTEVRNWEHLLGTRVTFVGGTAVERAKALRGPGDVWSIGVENLPWLLEHWLTKLTPMQASRTIICIDESSKFKNPRGVRGKALAKWLESPGIEPAGIWELTGTPRPNGYEDQFMPMRLLTRGKLWGRSFDIWQRKNFFPLDWNGYKWSIHPHARDQIIKDINSVSLTIPLEEMPDLPELNDGPQFIEWVDMPYDVRQTYKAMERHLVAQVEEGKIIAANMAVATGKLAQIVQGFLYEADGKTAERLHDVKMEALLEMDEAAGAQPRAIAYEFVEDLHRLQQEFPGIPYLGAGVSDRQAAEVERAWNEGQIERMALHPASAGHGLNLQHGGGLLFWYGMTWSAELYDQLIKRFHRPGQHRPVFSRPILMRDSVDEVKYERVRNKITAQQAFNLLVKRV